ncbi:MAG: type I restriction endonuclease subunit R [Anaerolineales bacterium]|nr:type I restriction endonuclease subunit R [Anaerolineales bacterium]
MNNPTNENAFETAIVAHLTKSSRYILGDSSTYSRELAFFPNAILDFVQSTQKEAWEQLTAVHGESVALKFQQRLFKELDNRGMLDVLRHGIVDYGVRFRLAYFQPASGLNPETQALYEQNILTVTRQVQYSLKNKNSIDLMLSLNGLPVATVELKNQLTGQDAGDAKVQYASDRDPNELLFQFKKRALVHFAVDTDEVWMTTRLDGKHTRYLPFNRGHDKGAGNPPNSEGHRTAYLWEQIWARDSWLDILARFIHLEQKEIKFGGKSIKKETLIFPRYHQLDVVRKLVAHARENGVGYNYLVQHSAGSGKSNSIAWLAYQLASLHNAEDERIFNSVIVVTDRIVLDRQLQDTIYQFEHRQGVVQKIDQHSTQLADALTAGTNIIITTLQKFPFVLDKIGELPKRNYAVIVDEAHSSQGGETAKKMKEALTVIDMERTIREAPSDYVATDEEDDPEDEIRKSMEARGKQPNLSFFAFTATPKPKTLEVFGTYNGNATPEPFHLYSMRQAIEEGFILDVLQNYTTYQTYFRLSKAIEEDPDLNKRKAARAIARFLSLHPHNLAQKTEVMVEHFRQCVMPKIGGKAKAMVVTASRPHVVRYKENFDAYLEEKGYKDIKALVAFTAFTDYEAGIQYSESEMNGFGERELPDKFASDEYQILLVAEKYQTGYDQPLLHTMYVDKKLSGVRAVQTLSRLNRIHPGKEGTFVLDFANTEEEILASFQPYYEKTILSGTTDPNKLYDLKTQIDEYQVIWPSEVDIFARVFFKPQAQRTRQDHGYLNSAIDPAVDRFRVLADDEQKEEFKNTLTVFVRTYAFLAQIMPFSDVGLEKFYAYARHLLNKLPKRNQSEIYRLHDEVALEYYRLQKIKEGQIELQKNIDAPLDPLSDAGDRQEKDIKAKLSEIIDILNKRFGTEFTEADRYFFSQIEEELIQDETLSQQARNNSIDNFKYGFDDAFLTKLIDRMDANQEIFGRIMDDEEFGTLVRDWMLKKVYSRINESVG